MADLTKALADVRAAQLAKEALLAQAIEGVDVSPTELEAADAECERAARIAELEEAKAKGAKLRAEKDAIEALKVRAKGLAQAYDAAVDQRIAWAGMVDDAIASLGDALEQYHRAGLGVNAAQASMLQHNEEVTRHLPTTNATLAAMQYADRPLAPRVNGGDPLPIIRPSHELFIMAGMGHARERKQVHSLEAHDRTAFRRPFVKAADAA